MKKITNLVAILSFSMTLAQTALNRDWFLQKMTISGVEHIPQNLESVARVTYDTGFGDINTQVCMQRSYNMTNITATQYGISQYSGIAGTCSNTATTDFQTKYLAAFQKTTNFTHSYSISGTGASQKLTITTSAGDILVYGTQQVLSASDVVLSSKLFSVHPNPVKNVININNKKNEKISKVSLYDLAGKLIFTKIDVNNQVEVSSLKKGVYLMVISSGETTEKIKIIKE